MWFIKQKRVENVDLSAKEEIRVLKARLTRLEAEVLDVATGQDIIRNKVLRKIQSKRPKDDEESSDLVDESGFLKTN